jgi:hypothetical protein
MNALVIKASPLYILKQMPHVLDFIAIASGKKKKKFWTIESIASPHNSAGMLHSLKIRGGAGFNAVPRRCPAVPFDPPISGTCLLHISRIHLVKKLDISCKIVSS